MKISLVKREKNTPPYGLIYGGIVLLFLLALYVSSLFLDLHQILSHYPCIFKRITHLPCLTCGMGRCTMHLSHLQIIDALIMNPLVFLVIFVILLWGGWSLISLITKSRRIKIEFTRTERRIVIFSVIMLVIINWIYLILMGH